MAKRKRKLGLPKSLKRRKPAADKALQKARDFVRGEGQQPGTEPPVRVTNETVAEAREEILSGARRFIYPLQHSKHRIAIISSVIVTITLLFLASFSWWLLYRQQSIGDFAYRISQIIPFPAARVNGAYVRYEEYLFELRHNVHYLANQENVDFSTPEGQIQMDGLRREAMNNTVQAVLIRQAAREQGVTVEEQEVTEQIDLIRSQGGVGQSAETLEDTLGDFYGWSLSDLRRVVRAQVLKQKLVPILDTEVRPRAESILAEALAGANFTTLASRHSDDEFTKDKGGSFGYIYRSNTEIPPQLVERAFTLPAGQVADQLVETLFGLHVVKTLNYRGSDQAEVAHILFRFKDISEFLTSRQSEAEIRYFVDLPDLNPVVEEE